MKGGKRLRRVIHSFARDGIVRRRKAEASIHGSWKNTGETIRIYHSVVSGYLARLGTRYLGWSLNTAD